MRTDSIDFLSPADRSALMRRVKGSGDEPERLLAAAMRKLRISFRTGDESLPGKPDFVLQRARLVVFIDGELWHGVQWRRRGLDCLDDQFASSRNPEYWIKKINANMQRDLRFTADLLAQGWRVLRLWEAEVRSDPDRCANTIAQARSRGAGDHAASALAPTRTACEFFAGMGLMRKGLEGAGWTTLWANDFDENKRRLYAAMFPDAHDDFDARDINLVGADDLPTCSLATASFPCVDLSLAGSQRGLTRDTRSGVYLRFIDILRDMGTRRPPLVLLENVTGLLSSNDGRDLEVCLTHLGELGYSVDAFTLNAHHFTPQSRPRLFIVGTHQSCGHHAEISLDAAAPDSSLRPARLVQFMRTHKNLPWSIRRLPAPPLRKTTVADIIEPVDDQDERWWNATRVEHFVAQVSGLHAPKMTSRMRETGYSYATAFRRMRAGASRAELRFDGVAGCLRTPKGGSAKQILVRMGHGRIDVRLMTPAECGRLMGVEDFRLPPGMRPDDALYGFGDAVCVPAVTWIARNYLDPLVIEIIRGRILCLPKALNPSMSKAQAAPAIVCRSARVGGSAKQVAKRRPG